MLKIPKNSAKNLNFWLIFGSFSITPSYTLAVAPQYLCQMKGLIEVHNRGKSHRYSICGCEVIKFQMFSWWGSIHEMAHSGEVLGPNSPQKCRNEIFNRGSTKEYKISVSRIFDKSEFLSKQGISKVCTFGLTLRPIYLLKMAEIEVNNSKFDKN